MTSRDEPVQLKHADRLYIGGEWVTPSTEARLDLTDSATGEVFLSLAEAKRSDIDRAVGVARQAFDRGIWPRRSHSERAEYLRALARVLRSLSEPIAKAWTRETGVLYKLAKRNGDGVAQIFEYYAGLAETFRFEESTPALQRGIGRIIRGPVGVVGAIIPWNAPLSLIASKVAPALLAGCSVVLKLDPGAPLEGYLLAEAADEVGLPAGVLNVVTANREVSEELVRDQRVDKITFTGSTAAGRRIAALCGERITRCTLELGGKSAALILDDMDIPTAARTLARAECFLSGQVCSSLTRIIITRRRHDEMLDALASAMSEVRVGDPFDNLSEMGPLAASRQRDRVESYIAKGLAEGATLATGGGRPQHLDRGWYIEPTVFGNVRNSSTIAQEEIFGPVLSLIPADDEADVIDIANKSLYGLTASVFTDDVERAGQVANQLRAGTVGHNTAFQPEIGLPVGGFKESGIGREGGIEGLLPFLETKTVVLERRPATTSSLSPE